MLSKYQFQNAQQQQITSKIIWCADLASREREREKDGVNWSAAKEMAAQLANQTQLFAAICKTRRAIAQRCSTYRSSLALKPTDAVVTLSVCRSSEPRTLRVAVGFLLLLLWLVLRLLLGSVLQRGRKISLSCVGRGGRLCSGCGEANGDKSAASCDGVNEFARPRRSGEAERLVSRCAALPLLLLLL